MFKDGCAGRSLRGSLGYSALGGLKVGGIHAMNSYSPLSSGQGSKHGVYLDCNATTPVEPRVLDEVLVYLTLEYGNSGSRTHDFGKAAKDRVEEARRQVAAVVACAPDEVIFTS